MASKIRQTYKGIAAELAAKSSVSNDDNSYKGVASELADKDKNSPVVVYTYKGPARRLNFNSSFLRNRVSVTSSGPLRLKVSRS